MKSSSPTGHLRKGRGRQTSQPWHGTSSFGAWVSVRLTWPLLTQLTYSLVREDGRGLFDKRKRWEWMYVCGGVRMHCWVGGRVIPGGILHCNMLCSWLFNLGKLGLLWCIDGKILPVPVIAITTVSLQRLNIVKEEDRIEQCLDVLFQSQSISTIRLQYITSNSHMEC